jgi:hypothetical protein
VQWGRKRIHGTDYDLSHLDPFMLQVRSSVPNAQPYVVRVSFGHHCFTRDLLAEDGPDLHFRDGRDLRCFCPHRHKLSLELPGMIRYAAKGRAYFNAKSNFLIVESLSEENAPYVAYFNVEKSRKGAAHHAVMFVTSAHLKPALPDKLPAVTFATLVDHKVNGKPLKPPPPRRVIVIKRK